MSVATVLKINACGGTISPGPAVQYLPGFPARYGGPVLTVADGDTPAESLKLSRVQKRQSVYFGHAKTK